MMKDFTVLLVNANAARGHEMLLFTPVSLIPTDQADALFQ